MLKKPPRVRDSNGDLQVRLRLDGRDHFINRLVRFDDPVAQARGQAICAEIWRDALWKLSEDNKKARGAHANRLVKRFGLQIRSTAEVDRFLVWIEVESLAVVTNFTILNTILSS